MAFNKKLTYLLSLLCVCPSGWAESFVPESPTGLRFEASNGISEGVLDQTLADSNSILDDFRNGTSGREFKAESAESSGNTGKGVATATGIALISRGTAMMASPLIPVRIAGADLVAKGALELAQAAADANSENQNRAQKNLLLEEPDSSGSGVSNSSSSQQRQDNALNELAQAASTPELENFLSERGVNSDAFLQDLVAGRLDTPDAVLQAVGMGDSFSPEQLEAGNKMASEKLGEIFSKRVLELEEGTKPALSQAGQLGSGSVEASSADVGEAFQPEVGEISSSQVSSAAPFTSSKTASSRSEKALPANDFLLKAMGKLGKRKRAEGGPESPLSTVELRQRGIRQGKRVKNVFFLAQQLYRNYDRWRKD